MVDENACKSFVEHQEFLATKAQKKASERNTNIDWNNEDYSRRYRTSKKNQTKNLRNTNFIVFFSG